MKYEKFLRAKQFLFDLLFPKLCVGCGREGEYLCQDCLGTIDILEYQSCPGCGKRVADGKTCQICYGKTKLNGLYFASSYQNPLIKKMIRQLKYEALAREFAKSLAFLIITHFQTINKRVEDFSNFILIPIPLDKKRLKTRGFNQAREIAKELADFLKIPLLCDVLIKQKSTPSQTSLNKEQRKENVKDVFFCKNSEKINSSTKSFDFDKEIKKSPASRRRRLAGAKILLVDDVYTTGSTMTECSRLLKQAGAKEVWGVAVARE